MSENALFGRPFDLTKCADTKKNVFVPDIFVIVNCVVILFVLVLFVMILFVLVGFVMIVFDVVFFVIDVLSCCHVVILGALL